jgi:hypothetical protein
MNKFVRGNFNMIIMSQRLFRNRPKFSWLALIVVCYLNVGCGPVYDSDYSFTPPSTPEGSSCVNKCKNARASCEQDVDARLKDCERRTQRECEGRQDCYTPYYCGVPDYEQCESQYRSCYQSCGGTVKSEEICVMGCD